MVQERLRGVEAARAIAALLVLLYHATRMLTERSAPSVAPLGGIFWFGYAGVDIFFVLSGFIIGHVHGRDVDHPSALSTFAWRRVSRIFPVYWLVLAMYLALLAVSPSHDGFERSPGTVLTSVLLLPDPQDHTILGVAWTLKHEILFYAMFGLLIAHRRLGTAALTAWAALTACAAAEEAVWGSLLPFPANFIFSPFNVEFLVGLAVCAALRLKDPRFGAPALAAGLAIGAFAASGLGPPTLLHPLFSMAAGLGLYGAVRLERTGGLTVPSWLVLIGSASYSIYLTHTICIMILDQALRLLARVAPIGVTAAFLLVTTTTLALGLLFYVTIERPTLGRLRASVRQRESRRLGRVRSRV